MAFNSLRNHFWLNIECILLQISAILLNLIFSVLGHASSNAVEMLSNEVGALVRANLNTCIGFTWTNASLIVEI